MKKIVVNKEACIGCGACVAIDSEHFAFNDEGLSHPISAENLESSDLSNAIDSCPTSAISIKEVDGEEETDSEDNDECCGECECCCNHKEAEE